MAALVPYEGDDAPEAGQPTTAPTARITVRPSDKLVPYEGGDAPAETPAASSENVYPQGLAGTAKAQMSGQMHGMTSVLGIPGDVASWAANKAGVGKYVDPFLPTSKWMRKILDLPGRALGLEGHATYNDINEVPETYRPQARAGEAIGSGLPVMGGLALSAKAVPTVLNAAAQTTPSVTRNILNAQRAAAASPGFAASQAPAALGAGAGGYGAELLFPGSDTGQMLGQLGGGLALSGAVSGASNAASRIIDRVKEPLSTLTDEGARTAIARSLAPKFAQHGEDVDTVIRNLGTPDTIPGALPAERSGSKVLMGVQNNLAEGDEALANRISGQQQRFRRNVERGVEEGFDPGSEAALGTAGRQYDDFLTGIVNQAEEEARVAAGAMSMVGPAEREALNVRARTAVERSYSQARATENNLWADVPGDLPVNPENMIEAYNAVRAGMLDEQRLPGVIERTINRIIEDGGEVPLRQLRILRSEALNEARKARATEDLDLSRRLNEIANGAPGTQGGILADMSQAADPVVAEARDFSRALNDRFSRSFVGDILGMSESGEAAIRPGLTLERTFSGKPAVQAQQAREVRQATEPVGYGPPRQAADPNTPIGEAQQEFLRTQTQKFVNPETGRINVAATQRYMRDNAQVLDQFPQFRAQLDQAVTSELAAQQLAGTTADSASQQVFAKLIKSGEKPAIAVGRVVTGENPVRDFAEMARLAQRSGPEAVAGLRASVLSFVTDRATSPGQGLSFTQAQAALTKPVVRGGPSLMDMMQNNRIITPAQRSDIESRIKLGVRHESAPGEAVRIDEVGNEAGRYARWGARMLGAKMASWVGATGGGAGTSLQVANIAASAAERALAGAPVDKAKGIISRAMQAETPDELIAILEKINTPKITLRRLSRQPELISILRPLFPRTESKPNMQDLPTAAQNAVRGLEPGP